MPGRPPRGLAGGGGNTQSGYSEVHDRGSSENPVVGQSKTGSAHLDSRPFPVDVPRSAPGRREVRRCRITASDAISQACPDSAPILLQTKLHRPRLPRDLVTRERLIERLNREAERPLILVCAPAGFGKTTLIGSWLERMDSDPGKLEVTFPSAWLSLDENDSDLTVFMRYCIAALRSVIPEACTQTAALLQPRQLPPPAVLHAIFSNDLAQLPTECILVLDDYQTIQGTEVHDLLGNLVRHWPDPLHLVLLSRISPPIPLGSLRAKGLLTEVRTRDLRFTPEETAAYLRLSQAHLSQKALPLLEERLRGLACRSASGGPLPALQRQPEVGAGSLVQGGCQHHRLPGG